MKYDKITLIMTSFNWMLFPCSSLSLKIENTEQHLSRKVHTLKETNLKTCLGSIAVLRKVDEDRIQCLHF